MPGTWEPPGKAPEHPFLPLGAMVRAEHLLRPHLDDLAGSAAETRPGRTGYCIVDQAAVSQPEEPVPAIQAILARLGTRSLVLVGMMGAGKSSIGRKLSQVFDIPFVDADPEIEAAAGMTIPEIFATYGEPYFRAGEARVIARLLDSGPQILATGGGAFMRQETREAIAAKGLSIWLKADFEVLIRRVRRRTDRPLLKTASPAATLKALIAERYPIYALADITIWSRDVPHETIVAEILAALAERLGVVGELPQPIMAGDEA